jgi:hypothetical protein
MAKGKMLAFAVILSFVGASDAFAQHPDPKTCKPCYLLRDQPTMGGCRIGLCLDIRDTNDLKAPVRTLRGLRKFSICKEDTPPPTVTGLLHVITVGSIVGGSPATEGWIEANFKDRQASTCSRALVRPRRHPQSQ